MPAKKKTTRGRKPYTWTPAKIALLKQWFPAHDNEVVAEKIGETVDAVRRGAQYYKVKKSGRYWDKPWEDFIVKNWAVMTVDELAIDLKSKFKVDKTKWAIINKYRELTGKR